MKTILKIFLTLNFLLDILVSFGQETNDKYYGKHVIIAIDQTGDVYRHQNMKMVYNWLECLLKNEKLSLVDMDPSSVLCSDFVFNENTDHISLYAFGLEGKSANYPYDKDRNVYMRIKNKQQTKVVDTMEIARAIIDGRIGFDGEKGSVSDYLKNVIHPLMFGEDKKAETISEIGGVTFSFYVYPTILALLDVGIPAEEYYFVFITNFNSGSMGGVNSKDETLLGEWLTNDGCENKFKSMLSSLNEQYAKTEIMSMIPKNKDEKTPIIKLFKLNSKKTVIESSEKADIESNINISQKEYGSPVFKVGKVDVRLPNSSINNVLMVMKKGEKEDLLREYIGIKKIGERNRSQLPEMEFKCMDLKEGEVLDFKYVFYPQRNVNDLLPLVYTAEKSVKLNASNFAPEPDIEPEDTYWWLIVIGLLFIVGVFVLCKFIHTKRGLERKAWVDFVIRPVSYSRFMEVRDKKVINEDCWYMGPDNQNQKITIEGRLYKEELSFCKQYDYRVEYCVEDADSEEDFTFRPDGIDGEGEPLTRKQWYRLEVNPDGKFKFNVLTYLDIEHSPKLQDKDALKEFFADKEHPDRLLQLHIKFRILVMDSKKGKGIIETLQLPDPDNPGDYSERILPNIGERDMRFEQFYKFIVKPDFDRKTAWVAFDPGTTGSCAAFAFSGHNPWDPDAVTISKNRFTRTDSEQVETSNIFPSVIRIKDDAACFKSRELEQQVSEVEGWELDTDFIFGNRALQRLGNNRFSSIKKLLGYSDLLEIKDKKGRISKISGKDLALLIVKGLYKNVESFAMDDDEVDNNLKENMTNEEGRFAPTRAIVAVPNNYTLLKIQDMVDSVKRLGYFKEVHYLYESEGVMMTYLHNRWRKLSEDDNNKVFVVYDMGGATINTTAFSLDIKFDNKSHNITSMSVRTIAKVGYCVGGDDIDYALIRILYDIPTISAKFTDEIEKVHNMNQNKQKLIQFVTTLKLELIDKSRKADTQFKLLANIETFINSVCQIMKECGITVTSNSFTDTDKDFIKKQLEQQYTKDSIMTKYVYSKVIDAISELMSDLERGEVELIYSGRSSLYPYIQKCVEGEMRNKGFKPKVWNGFNTNDGYLDADKVKTAVVEGACWFALFNNLIRLDHSVITSSFGYIDQKGGNPVFVPVVKRLERYKDGKMEHSVPPIDEAITNVTFIQMLGSDYDGILDDYYKKKNFHKINVLDVIPSEIVNGTIEGVSITIEDNNNFTYDVETSANHITPKTNRYSRLVGHEQTSVKPEIVDENNESFVFSALQSIDEKFNDENFNIDKDNRFNTSQSIDDKFDDESSINKKDDWSNTSQSIDEKFDDESSIEKRDDRSNTSKKRVL